MVCLNWINQKITKKTFRINKNGNAKPKNAGNQKISGEMYLATIAMSKLIIAK